uniref:Uncharacterized protein n=1 Tax=Oryza meridionalis TaxID=40149 RepID=A0A0E0E7B2_9ORYZ
MILSRCHPPRGLRIEDDCTENGDPRPKEITISGGGGGGVDMVSPTAVASGGEDNMVGVGMSAPWLIGAAGASASATIKLGSDPRSKALNSLCSRPTTTWCRWSSSAT